MYYAVLSLPWYSSTYYGTRVLRHNNKPIPWYVYDVYGRAYVRTAPCCHPLWAIPRMPSRITIHGTRVLFEIMLYLYVHVYVPWYHGTSTIVHVYHGIDTHARVHTVSHGHDVYDAVLSLPCTMVCLLGTCVRTSNGTPWYTCTYVRTYICVVLEYHAT